MSKVGHGHLSIRLKDRCKVSKVGQGSLVHPPQGPLQGVQGGSGVTCPSVLKDAARWVTVPLVHPSQGTLQGVQGGSLGHLSIRAKGRGKVGHCSTCPSVSRDAARCPRWVTGSLVHPCP